MSLRDALTPGAPLASMAQYNQFITWKLVDKGDSQDKVPTDPISGFPIDPQHPSNWLDANTAILQAEQSPHATGVGFVFTEQDPFAFVDIDKCFDDAGQASDVAIDICGKLQGAAIELSQSGRGLHLFGRMATIPHSCKNKEFGTELYHTGRFVALTGLQAAGSIDADITIPMLDIVNRYFPPKSYNANEADWRETPVAEWAGPEDDDELINLALRSAGGKVFTKQANFKDLFTADVGRLSEAYPDTYGGRAYDASQADMALANQLYFWCGGNHERMLRLMWKSGLVRDKWDRENYIRPTILQGMSHEGKVYYSKRYDAAAYEPPPVNTEAVNTHSGFAYMAANDQLEHFKGCVYVRNEHKIMIPTGELLDQGQFRATYGGHAFCIDSSNSKTTKSAWEVFTESQTVKFPKVEGVCFRPDLETGEIVEDGHIRSVNTYFPASVEMRHGDITPFLNHLRLILPNERDQLILLAYMAACVQHKGYKAQWAPLIQGTPGNGKTLFTRCLAYAMGRRYVHWPQAQDLDNKFNAWLRGKLLIAVEDIYVCEKRQGVIETLKPMITGGDGIGIQSKGRDQTSEDICANFMFNSNHKEAIRKHKDDRRFAIFFTAQQSAEDLHRYGMTEAYFADLYNWLNKQGGYAYVAHYLQNMDIPVEFNFTGFCQRAPETTSTKEAIQASVGTVEQEVIEAIEESRYGFRGGWVSSIALDQLLDERRMSSRMPKRKRRTMMTELGYVLHPALPEGRCTTMLADGVRPRLYLKREHPDLLCSAIGAMENFQKAQTSP